MIPPEWSCCGALFQNFIVRRLFNNAVLFHERLADNHLSFQPTTICLHYHMEGNIVWLRRNWYKDLVRSSSPVSDAWVNNFFQNMRRISLMRALKQSAFTSLCSIHYKSLIMRSSGCHVGNRPIGYNLFQILDNNREPVDQRQSINHHASLSLIFFLWASLEF